MTTKTTARAWHALGISCTSHYELLSFSFSIVGNQGPNGKDQDLNPWLTAQLHRQGKEPGADGKKKTNIRKEMLLIDAATMDEIPQYDAFFTGDDSLKCV